MGIKFTFTLVLLTKSTGLVNSPRDSAAAGWPAPSDKARQQMGTPVAAGLRGSSVPGQSSQPHPSGLRR